MARRTGWAPAGDVGMSGGGGDDAWPIPLVRLLKGQFRKCSFDGMEPTQRRLTDPRELRAVSHPVRLAILEHLTVEGPMTATALGTRIGESPANCSWHLRKLAEHGFVEEAPGGTGRQRPWRAASLGMRWNDVDD